MQLEAREAELAQLAEHLDQTRAGRGRLVVISGEAGAGKSALLTWLSERAQAQGIAPVWGRAWEFADAPPYFPLRAALSSLGLTLSDEHSARPFSLWEMVLERLSRHAREAPVVWLIEDIHAADLLTLDLLTFLAQPLRVLPALLVTTARPRDPRLSERGEQRLLRMARDGADLRLAPLPADAAARLARRHAGTLSEAAQREIWEFSAGNPLFVVECARALKANGQRSLRDDSGISPTIRQVVLERSTFLPELTRELLASGAVLGRDFSASLLGRMHGLMSARVIDGLLPALRSGVLLEREPGNFSFTHVVVQGAVYESLTAEQRQRLHGLAARALDHAAETLEVLLERARHALGALDDDNASTCVQLISTAGARLEASGAFDRAHALYTRLLQRLGGETHFVCSGERLLHFAAIADRAGRVGESRAIAQQVLQRARAEAQPLLFALAALELGRAIRPGMVDGELVAALRAGLAGLPKEAETLSCRLAARLAAALQPASDTSVPVAMARDAIARTRALADDALLLEVLDVAGAAYVDYAPLALRLQEAEALLELARRFADPVRQLRAHQRLAFDRMELGDFVGFEREVSELLLESAQWGQPRERARALLLASLAALTRGDIAESDAALAEVEQLLTLTDDPSVALSFFAHGFFRDRLLQREDALIARSHQLELYQVNVPDPQLVSAALSASLWTRLEDAESAARELGRFWALGRGREGIFLQLLSEAAAFAGTRAMCLECQRLLLPFAGRDAQAGHVAVSYEGPYDRLLGLLSAALGEFARAEERLRAALALVESRAQAPWIARLRYELGLLLSKQGRGRDADELLRAAAELAEQHGMPGLARRARARLARTAPSSQAPRPPHTSVGLDMELEGEFYLFRRGDQVARIKASRGAELLARLISAPSREIHVLALASDESSSQSETNAGEQLDAKALAAYRARLRELAVERSTAESHADLGRLEQIEREQRALEDELARATGRGGKARLAGSSTERARVNVQRRLKDAIERIRDANAELGSYLEGAVRTGTYCCFRP